VTPPAQPPRESGPREPAPLGGAISFEEGDFHSLSADLASDPQYNDRRLIARRKLLALGKRTAEEAKGAGVQLDCRTSLHNPHTFNGMRVRRLWAYLTRPKSEKRRLRGVLGAELAKDLDAAYRNAYVCLALEDACLEVSLRIHADAWFDGQNLVNRVAAEGRGAWLELLNALPGFRLRLADWKGEWRCGELTTDALEEFLSYYTPGEHLLSVERRFPAGADQPALRRAAASPEAAETLVATALELLPLYRFAAWSEESDYLFASS